MTQQVELDVQFAAVREDLQRRNSQNTTRQRNLILNRRIIDSQMLHTTFEKSQHRLRIGIGWGQVELRYSFTRLHNGLRVASHGYMHKVLYRGRDIALPQAPLPARSAALDCTLAPMVCRCAFMWLLGTVGCSLLHGLQDSAALFGHALSMMMPSCCSVLRLYYMESCCDSTLIKPVGMIMAPAASQQYIMFKSSTV